MEDRLARLISRVGISREDSKVLLRKMLQNHSLPLTPAQVGKLIPTSTGHRRDRELVRKQMLNPLVDLGFMEKVTAHPKKNVVMGHPIPKSPYCAYRLSGALVNHVQKENPFVFGKKAQEAAETLDIFNASSTHEQLMDSCVVHFASKHLPGYLVVYRDPRHGPKMDLESVVKLAAAGLELDPGKDPCPDLVFWDERTDKLCIVEVVTSEGIINDSRRRVLETWVESHRPGMEVMYVTAFVSWKAAAPFMKEISGKTYVWVQESPFRTWYCG